MTCAYPAHTAPRLVQKKKKAAQHLGHALGCCACPCPTFLSLESPWPCFAAGHRFDWGQTRWRRNHLHCEGGAIAETFTLYLVDSVGITVSSALGAGQRLQVLDVRQVRSTVWCCKTTRGSMRFWPFSWRSPRKRCASQTAMDRKWQQRLLGRSLTHVRQNVEPRGRPEPIQAQDKIAAND